jgi:hypothetical protein
LYLIIYKVAGLVWVVYPVNFLKPKPGKPEKIEFGTWNPNLERHSEIQYSFSTVLIKMQI